MSDYRYFQYIGNKPVKPDNVAKTGIVWNGKGDVKAVPAGAADRLLSHPDIWVEVGADKLPLAPSTLATVQSVTTPADDSPIPDDETAVDLKADQVDVATTEDVKSAIFTLDRANPEHFTETGKPRVKAVSAALGQTITAALVAEAWAEIDG